jgi:hypothetical protein
VLSSTNLTVSLFDRVILDLLLNLSCMVPAPDNLFRVHVIVSPVDFCPKRGIDNYLFKNLSVTLNVNNVQVKKDSIFKVVFLLRFLSLFNLIWYRFEYTSEVLWIRVRHFRLFRI